MALSYNDAYSLVNSSWYQNRTKVAISSYENYLINTPSGDPNYDANTTQARNLGQHFDSVFQTVNSTLPGDSEVQNLGPGITDSQLQIVVEKILKNFYPPPSGTPLLAQAPRPEASYPTH